MDTSTWISSFSSLVEASDWSGANEFIKSTNEDILRESGSGGLRDFYAAAISEGLNEQQREEVSITDIDPFRAGVHDLFLKAKERLPENPGIKGIYFEYFYDGGDSCTGDLFLCEEYSDDDDGWGAEFGANGDIQGPDVSKFFEFDPEYSWSNLSRLLAKSYVEANLLAICVEELDKSGISGLPLAFAGHNGPMVRVNVA